MFNPYIQGWINYYSHFYRSVLCRTLLRIDAYLIRWGRNKYKRLRSRTAGARDWFARVVRAKPCLFAHCVFCMSTTEHREPYEPRGSLTDLGARGGEIPLRDSPILVDGTGLLMQAVVQAADIQDRDGGAMLMGTMFGQHPFLLKLYAEGGNQGPVFQNAMKDIMTQVNVESQKIGSGCGICYTAKTLGGGENARLAQPMPPTGQGLAMPQSKGCSHRSDSRYLG